MSKWKVPEGFTLTKIDGWYTKLGGAALRPTETKDTVALIPDEMNYQVWEYNDAEPFIWSSNENSPHRDPATAPVEGWNPNGRMVPMKGGWHPPVYTLLGDGEPKHVEAPIVTGKEDA